jgi:3-oxoacyl-[acyl-carrier-protein] synthase II
VTTDNKEARVVVVGLGAVTPHGLGVQAFWEGVRGGHVAIREVRHMPMEGFRTRIAGEVQVDFTPEHEALNPDGFHDRALDFTMRAAEEAMESCGVSVDDVGAYRWGVVIGTCYAGVLAAEEWWARRRRGESPDARLTLLVTPQPFAEALGAAFGLKGPALSIATACAASANAIGYAGELIRSGCVDAMLSGGSDTLSDFLVGGFHSLESLSPEPARPYSVDRKGLSLGEGSGMLVLMNEGLARKHGLEPLAELLSYSISVDGYHPTAPHPEGVGAARAITSALRRAGVRPEEVDYVNSHGTGTAKNDPAETAATKLGLGEAAYKIPVSSTKSMIGHLLGGAGAAEAVVTVKAVHEQVAPPTAGFTTADPLCDLDYVPNQARELDIGVALSNNFGFAGANASLLFARAGGRLEGPPAPDVDRVVITGLSALTTAGTTVDALFDAYRTGRSCTAAEKGVMLGRVTLTPGDFLAPKERKRIDRIGVFAIIAARLALADAALELTDENRTRVGVVVGTGVGPMESIEQFGAGVIESGGPGANPALFPGTVYNAAGGQVSIKLGAVGSGSTVCAGHAAAASAIAYGYDLAGRGNDDAIVVIAADALTDTVIAAYRDLGVVASDSGGTSSDGLALGEAGIGLVLERLGAAGARGARIYGEVLGYGMTSDACGIGRIDRDGAGVEQAMRAALDSACLEAADVSAVWSAASGLKVADEAEAAATERLLGSAVRVLTPKLALGEPMGAGAAMCAALALQGWSRGDDDASPFGPVLINGLSLGGSNFSIVLAPPPHATEDPRT